MKGTLSLLRNSGLEKISPKVSYKKIFQTEKNVGGALNAEDMDMMTIDEIFNGKKYSETEKFPGIIGLIYIYMDTIDLQENVRKSVTKYLDFISKRASGELKNAASWMRNFVVNHPDYKQDSKVSPKINYDLLDACVRIGRGEYHPADLLGEFTK